MPAQYDARARGEDVEAFVEARAQTFNAEQGQARRREFEPRMMRSCVRIGSRRR